MIRRIGWALSIGILLAAGWRIVLACGPDSPVAIFSFTRHPDLPRSAFLSGRLGVLRPSYNRAYLILAYRQLAGIGLDAREKEQVHDYLKDANSGWWDRPAVDWAKQYSAARAKIPVKGISSDRTISGGKLSYQPETNSFELNCADDAYRTALRTLESRVQSFGSKSRAVREWTLAQDRVFYNCDSEPVLIPDQAAPDLPAVIRADREYQIAAAHFYARSYKEARLRFSRIAQDSSSPWQMISRYLVARTLLRTVNHAPDPPPKTTGELQRETTAILSDSSLAPIHGMTVNLVHRLGVSDEDPEYFRQLARLLASRGQGNGLREEMWDFAAVSQRTPYLEVYREEAAKADPGFDLVLWMGLFQNGGCAGVCMERWRQTHALQWLVAALSQADYETAKREGLLNAARALRPSSPAYSTAVYHYYRLLLENREYAAVREGLDAILKDQSLPVLRSSVNLFRGLRLQVAPDLNDFLRSALRPPVLIGSDDGLESTQMATEPNKLLLDEDSTLPLNQETPLRILKAAALQSGEMPLALQQELQLSVFVRAVMLDQDAVDVARRLRETTPDLAPFLDAYEKDASPGGRRFAGAFLMIHRGTARPYLGTGVDDEFSKIWWCRLGVQPHAESRGIFLTPADVRLGEKEFWRLTGLGNGNDFLGSVVLPYAKAHREDPRVPEALHMLVRYGRHGCGMSDSWRTTQAAFQLLHRNYPQSVWAKRTPIWIKSH